MRRIYDIAGNQLTIDVGSVLDIPAEVVVSSDDYRLTMGGGVSAAILAAAGTPVALDAAKAVPREAGDVVVTTAGALPSRYVFHVVTIGPPKTKTALRCLISCGMPLGAAWSLCSPLVSTPLPSPLSARVPPDTPSSLRPPRWLK